MGDEGDDASIEKRFCNNCQSHIPLTNFTVHEIHCARNVTLCKQCNVGVSKSSWDDHQALYHTETHCEKCGEAVLPLHKSDHEANKCSHRLIACEVCEMEVLQKDFAMHHTYCSSRTEYCTGCRNYVKVTQIDTHDCRPPPDELHTPSRRQPDDIDTAAILDSSDPEARLALDLVLQDEYARREAALLGTRTETRPSYDDPVGSAGDTSDLQTNSMVPCELCGRSVNFAKFSDHSMRCLGPMETLAAMTPSRRRIEENFDSMPAPFNDDQGPSHSIAADLQTATDVPCEICHENINFARYATHAAECGREMDDKRALPKSPSRRQSPPGNSSHGASADMLATTSEVPCEVCGRQINFSVYEQHIMTCGVVSSDEQPAVLGNSIDIIPRERCGKDVKLKSYEKHALTCIDTVDAVTQRNPDYASGTSKESKNCRYCSKAIPRTLYFEHISTCGTLIYQPASDSLERTHTALPCEFCDKLVPSSELEKHQILCDKNDFINRLSSRTRVVEEDNDYVSDFRRGQDSFGDPDLTELSLTTTKPTAPPENSDNVFDLSNFRTSGAYKCSSGLESSTRVKPTKSTTTGYGSSRTPSTVAITDSSSRFTSGVTSTDSLYRSPVTKPSNGKYDYKSTRTGYGGTDSSSNRLTSYDHEKLMSKYSSPISVNNISSSESSNPTSIASSSDQNGGYRSSVATRGTYDHLNFKSTVTDKPHFRSSASDYGVNSSRPTRTVVPSSTRTTGTSIGTRTRPTVGTVNSIVPGDRTTGYSSTAGASKYVPSSSTVARKPVGSSTVPASRAAKPTSLTGGRVSGVASGSSVSAARRPTSSSVPKPTYPRK